MTVPSAIAAALTRLADQSAPHRPDHRRVVDDAERAFRSVGDAAVFLGDEAGEERLEAAVEAARRWGDDQVAVRGEALLDSLATVRTAATTPETGSKPATRSVSPRSHNPLTGGQRTG